MFAAFLVYIYLAENMDYLKFLASGIIKTMNVVVYVFASVSKLIP